MSLFRRSEEKKPHKRSDASWVYMESPDSILMDSPIPNGSTTVHVPSSNGMSPPSPGSKNISEGFAKKTKSQTKKSKMRRCLGENVLTMATLLGVILGVALGLGLRSAKTWTKREVMYVNYPGELFLNILKCLILPLIMSSLVAAVGSLDTKLTGKIGLRAVAYYMSTTVLAIVLGIILVMSIKPGEGKENYDVEDTVGKRKPTLPEDTLMDLVRNMFPPNILEAAIRQYQTVLEVPSNVINVENATNEEMKLWNREVQLVNQTNIMGIVVFSIILGITLAHMKAKGKPLLDVFVALGDAMMIITKAVIWLSPVGILFLIASQILEMKDLTQVVSQIGLYAATVLGGVLFHGFIILPSIYFILVRKNPLTFIINMGQALATAFGTASSSATLPVTITCLEEKNFVDPRVARFCLPIGATINMDGTALYEAVGAIFIAQVRQVPLSIGSVIAISITATAASIGAAGIPQAGIVTMVIVLNVLGLPMKDVSLILVVDWALDRFRTLVNVLGDAIGSAIVAHYSKNDLSEIEEIHSTEMTTL